MKTSHGLPIKLREYTYYCSSTSMGVPRDNMSSTQKKKKKLRGRSDLLCDTKLSN